MKILERIAQIDRKFAWSFLGVLLTVAIFWYTRDIPPALSIDVLSNARVYDIHEDIPQLKILFDGEDIKNKQEVLSFITLRFENTGGKPITQSMYDQTLPFGVRFSEGRIFPPTLIAASQDYLKAHVDPKLSSDNIVLLNKVVIDSGASYTLRVLVLHRQDGDPSIALEGKIAGIDTDRLKVNNAVKGDVRKQGQVSLWNIGIFGSVASMFAAILYELLNASITRWKFKRQLLQKEGIAAAFRRFQGMDDSYYADTLSELLLKHRGFGFAIVHYVRENGLLPGTFRLLQSLVGSSLDRANPEALLQPLLERDALIEVEDRLRLTDRFIQNFDAFQQFLNSAVGSRWRHFIE